MKKVLKTALIVGLIIAVMISISGCFGTTGDEQESDPNSIWYMLGFLVVIFGLFYFVMIRPQRRRQREHEDLMQGLQKGDRVITAGGLYGTIESLSEDNVVIKIESGATVRVARGSVAVRRER